nr:FAD-binding protein [Paraburkholderia hospita]
MAGFLAGRKNWCERVEPQGDRTGLQRRGNSWPGPALFGKGSKAYNRYQGDALHSPNPCVAPIERGPFYALKIRVGDVGTFAGLKADASCRVLDSNGSPIRGLFAVVQARPDDSLFRAGAACTDVRIAGSRAALPGATGNPVGGRPARGPESWGIRCGLDGLWSHSHSISRRRDVSRCRTTYRHCDVHGPQRCRAILRGIPAATEIGAYARS